MAELPRGRPRRRRELLHLWADARRAGGDGGQSRPRGAPELHVLRLGACGGLERTPPTVRGERSAHRSRSTSTTPRHARRSERDHGHPRLRCTVRAGGGRGAGGVGRHAGAVRRRARHRRRQQGAAHRWLRERGGLQPHAHQADGRRRRRPRGHERQRARRPSAHRARLWQPRRLQHAVRGPQRPDVGVPRRGGARVARHDRPDAGATARDRLALHRPGSRDLPGIRMQVVHVDDVSTYKDFTIAIEPGPVRRRSERLGRDPRRPRGSTPGATSIRPCIASTPTGARSSSICRRPMPRAAASSRSPSSPTSSPTMSTRSSPRSGWPTRTPISSPRTSTSPRGRGPSGSPRRTAPGLSRRRG